MEIVQFTIVTLLMTEPEVTATPYPSALELPVMDNPAQSRETFDELMRMHAGRRFDGEMILAPTRFCVSEYAPGEEIFWQELTEKAKPMEIAKRTTKRLIVIACMVVQSRPFF